MDLSIIIPAYKSIEILHQQLPILLAWASSWEYKTEVIVVVDGDNLSTYSEILKQFPVLVTGYEKNMGKGFAIKHGFKVSTAPLIIFTDADIPFSRQNMLEIADALGANVNKKVWAIGDRTLPGSTYFEHISTLRKAGSDFFLLIIKHTLGKEFADTQCGLKGFTRDAGEMVLSKSYVNRFAFDFECLFIARHHKIEIIKFPVNLRNQSDSTVSIFRDGWKVLKDVFKIIFWHNYDR